MSKYIVGINLPIKSRVHESGVALIDMEGNVLFAANEERFSREKLDGDFPEKSVVKMFEFTGVKKEDVQYVVVPSLDDFRKVRRVAEFILRERFGYIFGLKFVVNYFKGKFAKKNDDKPKEKFVFEMKYFWRDFIKSNFPNAEIVRIDHHNAHLGGAYFASPWEEALVVSLDGAGNLLSSVVAEGVDGVIKTIDKTFVPNSAGSFWGSVTKLCVFKSGTRHGGKVTGLAARGNPDLLRDKFNSILKCEGTRLFLDGSLFFDDNSLVPNWNSYKPEKLREFIGEASREDIAAAAQEVLEKVVLELVKNSLKKTKARKVVLAGGVFANVLLNQKIMELEEVDDIFVFPAMSDGGLGLGAAFYQLARLKKQKGEKFLPKFIKNVYLGPVYSADEIKKSLDEHGLKYRKMEKPAKEIADLIFDNKIIAFYHGRMEYGPRALGSRSIIYAPIDPTANDWLNKKLNRSEFMPFAPVTMKEHIKENYLDIVDDPIAAKFMTVTYNCTDKMKKDAPACVHVDGTARPQVISREDNSYYYDIISEYYKLSAIPTIINTSFNMHEEPIVASPEDAIRAFLDSGVDYLVMEDYLCSFEENKDKR